MSNINVLVVPAGSGMAVAAIKALKQDKTIKIISADVNKLAPGLFLSHKGYIIPPFDNRMFYSKLGKIIERENIDVIIPALDTILQEFSKRKKEFENMGTKVLVSEPKTIEITRDKWKTYNELEKVIPVPKSFIKIEDINIDYPLFIKPRSGSGSQWAYKVNSKKELDFFYDWIENPIIQEYLEGKEYTIDCLADMDGNLLLSIPRERIETKSGISIKGQIIRNEELKKMAKKVAQKLKFCGLFFFQAKEDKEGVPKLTEINARIAGTMCLSSFSGANIHSLAVRSCMGEKIEIPTVKNGLYITRYWEEIYLTRGLIDDKVYKI